MRKLILTILALLLVGGVAFMATGGLGGSADSPTPWALEDELALEEDPAEALTSDASNPGLADGLRETLEGEEGEPARVEAILRGRVVDTGSVPIAGAKVLLTFQQRGRGGRGRNNRRGVPDPVITGDDGTFAFVGQVYRNLTINLQITHGTHAPTLVDRPIEEVQDEVDLGDIPMVAGGGVLGRVTDMAGNGVPAATVEFIPQRGNRVSRARNRDELLPDLKTDQNGFFRVAYVMEGGYSVEARARHKQEGRSRAFEVENDVEVVLDDIRLGPGYEITGVVYAADGKPVSRASVELNSVGRGGGNFDTRTDREGRFAIDHLPPSLVNLEVNARGYLDHDEYAIDPVKTSALTVTLHDALTITGRVTDAVTGQPVEAFAARARRVGSLPDVRERETQERTQRTQEQLQAQMQDLRSAIEQAQGNPERLAELAQTFRQQLQGAGGGRGRGGRNRGGAGSAIPTEQVQEIRELLAGQGQRGQRGQGQRGQRGQGRRGQRGGQFGQGGRQQLAWANAVRTARAPSQRAQIPGDPGDEQEHPGGEFELSGLQEGIYAVDLGSEHHQRVRTAQVELRADHASPHLEIILPRGLTISGQVVDRSQGVPVPRARVQLMLVLEDPPVQSAQPSRADLRGRGGRDGSSLRNIVAALTQNTGPRGTRILDTRTDDQGRFSLDRAPAGGNYFVTAQASGHSRLRTDPFLLEADLRDLTLAMGSLSRIEGNVKGIPEGRQREVRVLAISAAAFGGGFTGGGDRGGRVPPTARVQPDGTYEFENLEAGKYMVRAYMGDMNDFIAQQTASVLQGGAPEYDLELEEGETLHFDVRLSSEPMGNVTGVVLHNGYPAAGFRVTFRRLDANPTNAGLAQVAGAGGRGGRGGFGGGFGSGTESATVNEDGGFRIRNVAAGEYQMTVSQGGRGGRGGRGGTTLHQESVYVTANTDNYFQVEVSTGSLKGELSADDDTPREELRGSVQLYAGATEIPEETGGGRGRGGRGRGRGRGGQFIRINNGTFEAENLATGPFLMVIRVNGREETSQQIFISGGVPTVVRSIAGKKQEPTEGQGGAGPGARGGPGGTSGTGGRGGTGRGGTGRGSAGRGGG